MKPALQNNLHRRTFGFTGATWILFAGCPSRSSNQRERSAGKPVIVATTGMIADVAKTLVGDLATVEQLIGPGVDPHLYRPSSDDVRSILRASLVLYNGLKLEGRMGDVLEKKSDASPRIPLCDQLPQDRLLGHGEADSAMDPHCWMDLTLWEMISLQIEEAIVNLLPDHRNEIVDRGATLRQKMQQLNTMILEWIQTIPETQRILISSHDAFQYFGKQYKIRVEGIQGISTTSEAGLKRIEELVSLIVEQKVPAVFIESSVPEKGVQSLREGAKQKGWEVALGGTLYTDAMGSAPPTNTYLGMMEHNARTIVSALGGTPTVPARPDASSHEIRNQSSLGAVS